MGKTMLAIYYRKRQKSAITNLGLSVSLLVVLIAGCAGGLYLPQQKKFERISSAYENVIRWSHFDEAVLYLDDNARKKNPPNLKKLKHIKVIEYKVKRTTHMKDKSQVSQIAEIQYYRDDYNVVKTVIDNQLWEYDTTLKNWYLLSGLPDFE
jgi:hypothetical protein